MLGSKQLAVLIGGSSKQQCPLQLTLRATICHKSELNHKKAYHFPYEKKSYNLFNRLFVDPFTKSKFNENSKIILVEGNVNSGKDEFARKLADELGMHYAPPIDLEDYFYSDYGFDYRALNPQLPERMRICDWKMFHENPSRHSVIKMLWTIQKLRLAQYIRALQHVFNTGQGVILNRSVFTDRVFIEAMHNLGWLPMGYLRGDGVRFYDWRLHYNYIRERIGATLNKPHLTIYLERPVEKCMESVKNSADPIEANSKALIPEFLEGIQEAYENVILPKAEYNGHVIRCKVEEGITDDLVQDTIDEIKDLNFEFDWHDTRFATWDVKERKFWHRNHRIRLTTKSICECFAGCEQTSFDIAGLGDSITEVDIKMRQSLYESQVPPVGFHNDFDTDIKQQGLIASIMDLRTWPKEWKEYVRSEYV